MPNGWAPLQWMACVGLERYGFLELAQEVAQEVAMRFVELAHAAWRRTGKLHGKI
jgi:alpha,alpha-trehalase